jgi:hypothetical protein
MNWRVIQTGFFSQVSHAAEPSEKGLQRGIKVRGRQSLGQGLPLEINGSQG